jgi:hypothetical protein
MWRREERLGYLLSRDSLSSRPDRIAGLREKIAQRFRLWNFTGISGEKLLSLNSQVVNPVDAYLETADVRDGLGALKKCASGCAVQETGSEGLPCTVLEAGLINTVATRTLRLPNEGGARIRQAKLTIVSYFQWLRLSFHAGVHDLENPQFRSPALGKANSLIPRNPAVRTMITKISMLPHRRASVDVTTLEDSDYQGFLQEARVIKGVPTDRGELLGVFRHVPVEVVSRLRYMAEERAIIYSIANTSRRTRIRVHDMAAVRDSSSQEIHLIPHRTRYRTVLLN